MEGIYKHVDVDNIARDVVEISALVEQLYDVVSNACDDEGVLKRVSSNSLKGTFVTYFYTHLDHNHTCFMYISIQCQDL